MRVVIAGSRSITDYDVVKAAIEESKFEITEVVSGNAAGVDRLAERWARENGKRLSLYPVSKVDWERHGKAAGPMRTDTMLSVADAFIAIWDGESKGTYYGIKRANFLNKRVFVKRI